MKKYSLTTIIITHNQDEAFYFADKLLFIHQGELVEAGAPIEIYKNPQRLLTTEFLGFASFFTSDFVKQIYPNLIDDNRKTNFVFAIRPEAFTLCAGEAQDSTDENRIALSAKVSAAKFVQGRFLIYASIENDATKNAVKFWHNEQIPKDTKVCLAFDKNALLKFPLDAKTTNA